MAVNNQKTQEMRALQRRINKALSIAMKYGGTDGDHHKSWVIDQMVRTLTGCPTVQEKETDANGKIFTYPALGESEDYLDFVRRARAGKDGPETYDWKIGIAP